MSSSVSASASQSKKRFHKLQFMILVNRSNIPEKEHFKNFTGALVQKRSRHTGSRGKEEQGQNHWNEIWKHHLRPAQRKWTSLSLQKLDLQTRKKLVDTEKLGVNAYLYTQKLCYVNTKISFDRGQGSQLWTWKSSKEKRKTNNIAPRD